MHPMSCPRTRRRVLCALLAVELAEATERASHACALHTVAPSITSALASHAVAVRALAAVHAAQELYAVACVAPLAEA